jgi:hypothetical protein
VRAVLRATRLGRTVFHASFATGVVRGSGRLRYRSLFTDLRFEKLGSLVVDVRADTQELITLSLLRKGEDECGEVLLLVVALNGGKCSDDESAGGQVVVHDALASVDSCQCEAVEQRVDVGRLVLPLVVLRHRCVHVRRRVLLDVQQWNEFRCLRVDVAGVGRVGLEPGVECDDVDVRRGLEGLSDVGGEKGEVRDPEQRILADRLLELVSSCFCFGCCERCAEGVRPLARFGNALESTDLVGHQVVVVGLTLRVCGGGLDGQRLGDHVACVVGQTGGAVAGASISCCGGGLGEPGDTAEHCCDQSDQGDSHQDRSSHTPRDEQCDQSADEEHDAAEDGNPPPQQAEACHEGESYDDGRSAPEDVADEGPRQPGKNQDDDERDAESAHALLLSGLSGTGALSDQRPDAVDGLSVEAVELVLQTGEPSVGLGVVVGELALRQQDQLASLPEIRVRGGGVESSVEAVLDVVVAFDGGVERCLAFHPQLLGRGCDVERGNERLLVGECHDILRSPLGL